MSTSLLLFPCAPPHLLVFHVILTVTTIGVLATTITFTTYVAFSLKPNPTKIPRSTPSSPLRSLARSNQLKALLRSAGERHCRFQSRYLVLLILPSYDRYADLSCPSHKPRSRRNPSATRKSSARTFEAPADESILNRVSTAHQSYHNVCIQRGPRNGLDILSWRHHSVPDLTAAL